MVSLSLSATDVKERAGVCRLGWRVGGATPAHDGLHDGFTIWRVGWVDAQKRTGL